MTREAEMEAEVHSVPHLVKNGDKISIPGVIFNNLK